MNEPNRFPLLAGVPLLAGTGWIWAGAQAGPLPFLLLLPVAAGLLGTGLALLLWAGDRRITQTMALAGLLGMVAFPGLAAGFGLGGALWLSLLAAGSALVAGSSAVSQSEAIEGVPAPEAGLALAAKVALDEMVLGVEQLSIGLPSGNAAHRVADEIHGALDLYRGKGWLDDPAAYHLDPPPLGEVHLENARSGSIEYEHLSFESGYEPWDGEPGRERWLGLGPPRTAHAYLLRSGEPDRPWLVCTNGYRMGLPAIDLRAFGHYHKILGLNVLIPVLPLHGPRRIGRRSGDGFLGGEVLDTVHAETQAIWDIRRMIGWLRGQGALSVGATGLSLGGYTTALLAGIEAGLACAVAGIPVADLARIFWRHGPPLQLRYLAGLGIDEARVGEMMTVVSPLAFEPRVPFKGRLIFGGTADRLVPPDHTRDLAAHWGNPPTTWYPGGHLSFRMDARVQHAVDARLREVGLCS